MKTTVDNKDINYKANKFTGPMGSSIDTSYNLPESFRTVDNTEVEVLDLILDENGNIVDPPVVNNSSSANSGSSQMNANAGSTNNPTASLNGSANNGAEILDGVEGSTTLNGNNAGDVKGAGGSNGAPSSQADSVESEILEMPANNESKYTDDKSTNSGALSKNGMALEGENPTKDDLGDGKAGKVGAGSFGGGSGAGINGPINIDEVKFSGELTPTSDDGSGDSSSGSSSGGSGEATSSSHRQTESLAYYSNDWVSIFDTAAESGYSTVLDSNYFSTAYAATGAKLSKNAKYPR